MKHADLLDPDSVAESAKGAEVVISAYSPPQDRPEVLMDATKALIAGLKKAQVARVIMVGGAGSLEVAPGLRLVDSPDFPAGWKGIARAHGDALQVLKESGLEWTSASPSAMIAPGERTGKFRIGKDQLLVDAKGESRISAEDFAIAVVDELEQARYPRARFTVGY